MWTNKRQPQHETISSFGNAAGLRFLGRVMRLAHIAEISVRCWFSRRRQRISNKVQVFVFQGLEMGKKRFDVVLITSDMIFSTWDMVFSMSHMVLCVFCQGQSICALRHLQGRMPRAMYAIARTADAYRAIMPEFLKHLIPGSHTFPPPFPFLVFYSYLCFQLETYTI